MLLTSACLCTAGTAGAAEWSAAPVLGWAVDHDSNRLLATDDQASQGALIQLDVLLKRATGTSSLSLQPHLGWQQYTNNAAQNTSNQSLQAAGTWRDDRSAFAAEASVARDNAFNNELADTGIVTGSTRRRSKFGALSWTHQQSEHNQLDVQFSYSDVDYKSEREYRLFGYRYPSISITDSIDWSPRTTIQLTAYGSRLISQGYSSDSDSMGARVGLNRALTSRITAFFSAGLSRQTVGSGSDSGYIGRFELTRTDVLGQWRLHAERSISASGYGVLVTRDDAGLSFDRRLTQRWSSTFALRSLRNNDIAANVSGERRRYERAEAGLGWQAGRTWRVNATASLTRARQTENSPLAEGWRAIVSLIWAPQPRLVSR